MRTADPKAQTCGRRPHGWKDVPIQRCFIWKQVWASLIPFAKVVDLLQQVLPSAITLNQETMRQTVYTTAERIEQELGEERQLNLFDGVEEELATITLPMVPSRSGLIAATYTHTRRWFGDDRG